MTEEQWELEMSQLMSFPEALEFLNIADYSEQIFQSNSHGDLFHLLDYQLCAKAVKDSGDDPAWFRPWFVSTVNHAKDEWERPESVYQHICHILTQSA